MHFPHATAKNIKMDHRSVVLPDYQGLGISGRLSEWLGQHLYQQGFRYRRVVAHPAVISYCVRSPRWRETTTTSKNKGLKTLSKEASLRKRFADPRRLLTRSFEFMPPKSA